VNRGVTYSSLINNGMGMLPMDPRGIPGGGPGGLGRGGPPRPHMGGMPMGGIPPMPMMPNVEVPVVSNTQIQITVTDALVGNILGRQGTTLREIMSLSGARITVSPRGEYEEGTTNRIVTIVGSPAATQTAHLFVQQKLSQPPLARPPRRVKPTDA
jgi:hypothetical protein